MSRGDKIGFTILAAYPVGAWLTFGYTLTHNMGTTVCTECRPWDYSLSIASAVMWPVYWFFKTAILAFGWTP